MNQLLTIFQDWSGLIGMIIASAVYFTRNENKTEDNAKNIERLEATINKLVEKIEKLIEQNSDYRSQLSNHEARLVNLEKKK